MIKSRYTKNENITIDVITFTYFYQESLLFQKVILISGKNDWYRLVNVPLNPYFYYGFKSSFASTINLCVLYIS